VAAAGVLVLAAAAASLAPDLFVLDREAVAQGEVWRLWTGHLVHPALAHFALDVGVGALLILFLAGRLRAATLVLPPVVGMVVLALRPEMGSYAGLSGVLHAWTVLVALDLVRTTRSVERILSACLLAAVIVKAFYEALTATSIFTASLDMGGTTLHEAHLVGVLAGLALAGWERLRGGTRVPQTASA
jgi:rhomboid family GlyGly-CTERM serine protease